jgi:DNA gyrase subunit A
MVNLIEHLGKEEQVCAILPVHKFVADLYVVTVSEKGRVKKTSLMSYARPRSIGLKAVRIEEGDRLAFVRLTHGDDEIFLASGNGKCIRFNETDVRIMGRASRGVKGMRLDEGDQVVGAVVVNKDTEDDLLTLTENGYGKRTLISEYRKQKRGGKGILTIVTSVRNGRVSGILAANDERELMIAASNGVLIRTSMGQISRYGRNTQGVRLIDLDKGATVQRAVSIRNLEEAEQEALEEGVENAGEEVTDEEIAAAEAAVEAEGAGSEVPTDAQDGDEDGDEDGDDQ